MFERPLTRREYQLIRQIEAFVRDKHAHALGHDYSHVLAVVHYALRIAQAIPEEVDPFVLICGALFHDIGRIGTHTGVLHGLRGASIASEYLASVGVPGAVCQRICNIVARHTPTSMIPPETTEEKVVYDADALDRLGLMGMLRGIMGKRGSTAEILADRMGKRAEDYDRLYFEESARIGEALQEETVEVIARFRAALDERFRAIAEIPLPVAEGCEITALRYAPEERETGVPAFIAWPTAEALDKLTPLPGEESQARMRALLSRRSEQTARRAQELRRPEEPRDV
jgi:putative nucleotidyltransferase with HDIG domain